MVQGYYTLEEAANILGMSPEKLSQMANKREIRAFADRGTWRFRTQDVEEMARRMGHDSNPDLQLGEAPPTPRKRTTNVDAKAKQAEPTPAGDDLFGFDLGGASEPLFLEEEPKPKKKRTTNPPGKTGEDDFFEFELSSEGSIELDLDSEMGYEAPTQIGKEAPLGFKDEAPPPPMAPKTSMPAAKGGKTSLAGGGSKLKKTSMPPEETSEDDDVLSLEEHVLPADSDVNLDTEAGSAPVEQDELPLTEEVLIDDLDAELRKAEEARGLASSSRLPTQSPFELSEADLDEETPHQPAAHAEEDDEVSLGELSSEADFTGAGGASGINLHLPADTGINLEKSGPRSGTGGGDDDEVEFELSLDADSTPAPSSSIGAADSSEFELTLDDSGGLAPLDGEGDTGEASEEKDIFETDLEIPALDEESASEAVALEDADTDLESSDFDFDATANEEDEADASHSQVVALEDEEDVAEAQREEEDELEGVGEVDAGEPALVGAGAAAAAPAPWGALPAIFLLPGVIVMFLLGLMTFELLHGMWGYKQPYKPTGVIIRPIASLFGADLPND